MERQHKAHEEIERKNKVGKTFVNFHSWKIFVSFHKTCENTNQNNNMRNSIA